MIKNISFTLRKTGAVGGTRTRDPRLGKPMLYQLSYYRKTGGRRNQKKKLYPI